MIFFGGGGSQVSILILRSSNIISGFGFGPTPGFWNYSGLIIPYGDPPPGELAWMFPPQPNDTSISGDVVLPVC